VAHFSLGGPDERLLRDTVPIGYPVANTRLYVLDAGMLPVPVGVSGDLYVGGVPVGRGYLSEPARTAEAFVPDPFAQEEGARLYRTGDLARYQADGALEFVGRSDYQVKLRGYRIELHEIEAALNRHPVVRESAVLLREDAPGNQFLAAYIVPLHEGMISARQLQSTLREQLPEYMIPPSIVFLQSFPLTANGKLDRRALPQPDADQSEEEFVAPRNATEERLVEIWCAVLEHEHISVTANFFVVGGHSLLATQVLARIRDVFQVELPVRALFKSPTIAGIAAAIERMQVRGAELRKPSMTPISRESYRRSPRMQEKGTEG
jgi:acyl carrier protein